MLKNDFFTIKELIETQKEWIFRLSFNAMHPIYQAHFQGNPVTPGACLVQLIKELVSDYYSKTFFIRSIKNVKFLKVLNPLEHEEVFVHLACRKDENGMYAVSAIIRKEEILFSKINLMLED